MPVIASLAAALIGGGISAYGAHKSAKDANKAGAAAQGLYSDQTGQGMGRLGSAFFGNSRWNDLVTGTSARATQPKPAMPERANFGGTTIGGGPDAGGSSQLFRQAEYDAAMARYAKDITAWEQSEASAAKGQQGAMADFTSGTGGPLLDQLKGLNASLGKDQQGLQAGYGGLAALMGGKGNAEAAKLQGGYGNLQGSLMALLGGGMKDTLGGYERQSADALNQFGRGREQQIRGDFARDQQSQTNASTAALTARGFGNSTAVANQASQIGQATGREQARALTDLGDQKARLGLGVASERAGIANGQYGRLADAMSAIGLSGLGAQERTGQNNLGRLASIQGAGLASQERGIDRAYGAGLNPINTQLGVLQGNVMNPYLGHNTTQYFPGASPLGAAAGQAGGGLAALGSYGLGSALTDQQIQEYLKRINPQSSGNKG